MVVDSPWGMLPGSKPRLPGCRDLLYGAGMHLMEKGPQPGVPGPVVVVVGGFPMPRSHLRRPRVKGDVPRVMPAGVDDHGPLGDPMPHVASGRKVSFCGGLWPPMRSDGCFPVPPGGPRPERKGGGRRPEMHGVGVVFVRPGRRVVDVHDPRASVHKRSLSGGVSDE